MLDGKTLGDAELVRLAREGDQSSLGQLFTRYRPQLYATALSVLGHGAGAEDAVHDAFLTVLTRLDKLRDPAAVGSWLHAILRNRCLMELRRSRRYIPPEEAELYFRELADERLIESQIESREFRDWVWIALAHLPEAQRVAVMLRYFGSYDSYEDLARILAVPVGTVRSRLFDAKAKLTDILLACTAGNDEASRISAERLAFYTEAYRDLCRGERDTFLAHYTDDLHYISSDGRVFHCRAAWDESVDYALDGQVQPRVERVVASGHLTLLEISFQNPPEDPFHCPPGAAFVLFSRGEHTYRMHHHLAPQPPQPSDE